MHSVVFIIMYVAGFYLQSTYAVKGFEIAKIANYDAKQLSAYEQSYNDYLGFKASMDYKYKEGMEKEALNKIVLKELQDTNETKKSLGDSLVKLEKALQNINNVFFSLFLPSKVVEIPNRFIVYNESQFDKIATGKPTNSISKIVPPPRFL